VGKEWHERRGILSGKECVADFGSEGKTTTSEQDDEVWVLLVEVKLQEGYCVGELGWPSGLKGGPWASAAVWRGRRGGGEIKLSEAGLRLANAGGGRMVI
jgi:hypothetical protein